MVVMALLGLQALRLTVAPNRGVVELGVQLVLQVLGTHLSNMAEYCERVVEPRQLLCHAVADVLVAAEVRSGRPQALEMPASVTSREAQQLPVEPPSEGGRIHEGSKGGAAVPARGAQPGGRGREGSGRPGGRQNTQWEGTSLAAA